MLKKIMLTLSFIAIIFAVTAMPAEAAETTNGAQVEIEYRTAAGAPIADAAVRVRDANGVDVCAGTSSASGTVICNLAKGEYTVEITSPGGTGNGGGPLIIESTVPSTFSYTELAI